MYSFCKASLIQYSGFDIHQSVPFIIVCFLIFSIV